MGELRADRLAGAGPEAAIGPRVHPGSGLPGLPDPAGEADEVAAVADHDRITVEEVAELLVDNHRMQWRAVVVEYLLLLGTLLHLGAAHLLDPGRCALRVTLGRLADLGEGGADVAGEGEVGQPRLLEPRRGEVELNQGGVLADRVAEAETEVEGHADHQADIAALEAGGARAG